MSRQTNQSILAISGVASLILLAATLIGTLTALWEANAQNATTATNQSGTATANQTGMAATLANLTSADFEPIRENIALARESIHNNDRVSAYSGLGWADNEIFVLANEQGNQTDVLLAELKPLQDSIQKAQAAIQQRNNATALNEVGSAEIALLQVTQQLPTGETEEPEEPEEEDTE